jgi:hypothetical protein
MSLLFFGQIGLQPIDVSRSITFNDSPHDFIVNTEVFMNYAVSKTT